MDPRLVMQAQQGDEAAFAAITRALYGRYTQVAYRVLGDWHLAEDATQQALVQIWRKLPRLRDRARFDAWAYRILVNACLTESRGRKRRPADRLTGIDPASPDEIGPVGTRDELERAFEKLSTDQRVVIVLHFYLGMTIEQVAEVLDVPVGTVGSRLGRGLARLRQTLGARDDTGLAPNGSPAA